MKSKGERERYTQLNAEFQRIARRYKKAFLNEKCKRKIMEWERLEICWKYQGNISFKDEHNNGKKW